MGWGQLASKLRQKAKLNRHTLSFRLRSQTLGSEHGLRDSEATGCVLLLD